MKYCSVDICTMPAHAKGMCSKHYSQCVRQNKIAPKFKHINKRNHPNNKGPLSHKPTYISWVNMRQRCNNPKHISYKYYGAKGIAICSQWQNDYYQFLADMGERPTGMTLDRIDHNGNYEPGNVRWANKHQQAANRRGARKTVGVYYNRYYQKWEASLVIDNIDVLEGLLYDTEEDAQNARWNYVIKNNLN